MGHRTRSASKAVTPLPHIPSRSHPYVAFLACRIERCLCLRRNPPVTSDEVCFRSQRGNVRWGKRRPLARLCHNIWCANGSSLQIRSFIAFSLNRRFLRALNSLAQRRQCNLQLVRDRCEILKVIEGLRDALVRWFLERFEAFRDARSRAKNAGGGHWPKQEECSPDDAEFADAGDRRRLHEAVVDHGRYLTAYCAAIMPLVAHKR